MKKKIFALVLCVAMLAIAIVGGTLAYFTDTKDQTNTFTAGKVEIYMDEAAVEEDTVGNLVAKSNGARTSSNQSYHLFPGMTVCKDPTIAVRSGSENAYIGAVITIQGDLESLYGVQPWGNLEITQFVSGGITTTGATQKMDWNGLSMVYENDSCVVYQDYSNHTNKEWKIYVFVTDVKKAGDTVTLFDTLTISSAFDNKEMAKLNNATVKVEAYATQAHGFADCFTAMTKAFPTVFNFSTATT